MTNSLALVPVFAGTINSHSVQLCDARTLHTFMIVLRDFSNWIKGRIRKFGFVNGVDFIAISRSPELASGVIAKTGENLGGRPTIEYHLTLDMAKELAMVENNPKGREARRYFIDCEKQTQTTRPMLTYARISPAQAQHLTELVDLVVESGRQKTHAETWARFHRKMGVNKYSLLPSARFDEAVQYLRGKMDDQNMAALVQKHLPHAVAALPAPKAATASVSIQLMQVTTINGASTVEILPASELPQLILRRDSPFTAAEVLEVAQHANMRITNEVGRLERNSEAARMEKAILALGVGDLAKIAKSAWLELAYRAAGPGAGMAATA